MTTEMTNAASSPTHRSVSRLRLVPIGAGASLLHAVMLIPGYSQDGPFEAADWAGMLVVSLVVAGIVFTTAVPGGGPVTAVVLGVVSVLGALAFWVALAFPLAAGAIVVGLRSGPDGRRPRAAAVGLGLGVLAIAATIGITVWDAAANY